MNERSLIGMWKAVTYEVDGVSHDLSGLVAFSRSHLVAAIRYASTVPDTCRLHANAGPYEVEEHRIQMLQWIQLHYDEAQPQSTLNTKNLPEEIEYEIVEQVLVLVFPSKNRMILTKVS
ncbi:hypothetical protein [Caballeronia sp. HLA56]